MLYMNGIATLSVDTMPFMLVLRLDVNEWNELSIMTRTYGRPKCQKQFAFRKDKSYK